VLQFNTLDAARGHDVFDLDRDGAISWRDFHRCAAHVRLPVAEQDLRAAFRFLASEDGVGTDFRGKQLDCEQDQKSSEQLENETIENGRVIRARWMAALGGRSATAARAFDEIAAYLDYFGILPEEGYGAFDSDGDGAVSVEDLRSSAMAAGLELAEEELMAAFSVLDPDGTGHAARGAWSAAVGAADASYSIDEAPATTFAANSDSQPMGETPA
jgi:hypothetical protein